MDSNETAVDRKTETTEHSYGFVGRRLYLWVKRLLDFSGSVTLLLILAPLLGLAALAIKLDSPGPVVFRQRRVGKDGVEFTCHKFRTMSAAADDGAHRRFIENQLDSQGKNTEGLQKLTHDSRITRVGKWLRRASIDELLQLINVVRGEMSLVGPRPALPYEARMYDEKQKARLTVLPGMTGLWQVSGRSRLSYQQMLKLDVKYVSSRSLLLDGMILIKTLPTVLRFWEAS